MELVAVSDVGEHVAKLDNAHTCDALMVLRAIVLIITAALSLFTSVRLFYYFATVLFDINQEHGMLRATLYLPDDIVALFSAETLDVDRPQSVHESCRLGIDAKLAPEVHTEAIQAGSWVLRVQAQHEHMLLAHCYVEHSSHACRQLDNIQLFHLFFLGFFVGLLIVAVVSLLLTLLLFLFFVRSFLWSFSARIFHEAR